MPLDLVGYDPVVRDAFAVMPAAMLTLFFFAAIKGCILYFDVEDLQGILARIIALPFAEASKRKQRLPLAVRYFTAIAYLEITFAFTTFHTARCFIIDNTSRTFRRYGCQGFIDNFIQRRRR